MAHNFAGDIDIEQITIVGRNGEVFNVSEIFLECNIFQNIFRHYLECSLVINDAINIQGGMLPNEDENTPGGFKGGEVLVVSYREKTDPEAYGEIPLKKHLFGIYEVSNRSRASEGSDTYILNGISLESFATSTQKISKAYGQSGGNSISGMMKSLMNEYVLNEESEQQYLSQGFNKTVEIDETAGKRRYVIPNYDVDKTIEFFCKKADSDSHYPLFLFYEDSNGYKFKNVAKLIEDGEIDFTYHYYPFNYNNQKDVENDDQYKIINFKTLKENNFLENIRNGMFKSKSIGIDIQRKTKTERVFDYNKEQGKFTTTVGGYYPVEIDGNPVINVSQTKFGQSSDPFFVSDGLVTSKNDIALVNRKQSYRKQLFNNILQVTIPGDSSKNVGELIDLQFYINNDIESEKGNVDKTLSGQYLITKVRQHLTSERLNTVIECCKDTSLI